jgi:hypothetical protein
MIILHTRHLRKGINLSLLGCGKKSLAHVWLSMMLLTALNDTLWAATYYVATTGMDSTSPTAGTISTPFRTIGFGLSRMSSGDTLLVQDGLYLNQANFINDGIHAIANGTAAARTRIRAVNPYRVRIRNQAATAYYDFPMRVRGSYIDVEGFVLELRNSSTPFVAEIGGSYNRLMRSILRMEGFVDQFGGWLYVGGHHQLIEDVGGVGAARYGFSTGGPEDTSNHIIFRRVVGRFDFSSSLQPKATFNAYGTNSGFGVHHVLYQNCIALDGQRGPDPVAGSEGHYGAWYFPKNMDAASIQGSIALNNQVYWAGLFVQEQQGRATVVNHSVVWSNPGGPGVRWNGTGSTLLENMTVGGNAALANGQAIYNGNSTPAVLRRSLFASNSALFATNEGFSEFSGSAFLPSTQNFGTSVALPTGPLRYLPDASLNTGLSNVGAVIRNRIGRSGSIWGEPGYDELTNEPLWPFPNENELKTVFAEANTPAAGNTPSTNNTVRGFTVANDGFGRPMTLTRYVWQYLGYEIPASIYGGEFDNMIVDGFE